ncbi:type II toxin-antitoxin system mRNA interferase toxin, RelE/StbE family [Bacteriovorax sp. PP10]|uniref:Type II toxin-antitoxin system mRNA interferase toxin, RelE/StbE family n=1 Tax=Bacteriovorax antarcticus TaxID=3088717 RepID=A0ABU5VXE4_9BACT|nr:type II toxin-antitoxin system mRNA interferase toxin, RelE/StbE family [Bacteriovorax sp. PP10]MEA9357272.1 type II toxin-antitoxin system mRNA interferase toxin, RelE/StbE family [Bacteriovorax sp. PP10]
MKSIVNLSKGAQRDLKKIPRYIQVLFDLWVEIIENEGYQEMQKIRGYRDHSLKGDRYGQRSSSLNKSWRIIYELDEQTNSLTVEVLEVNNHDY